MLPEHDWCMYLTGFEVLSVFDCVLDGFWSQRVMVKVLKYLVCRLWGDFLNRDLVDLFE